LKIHITDRLGTMVMSRVVFAYAVALSLFLGSASADDSTAINEVDADREASCSCSPSKFTFTLDLSLTCPPVDVTRNDGIAATFCQISPFGDLDETITDLVPVEVEYVDVLELGQMFEVLSQKNITGVSSDGDTFDYESIVGNSEQLPKVIQLNIFGRNAEDQPVVNFFAISFTNYCDTYPTMIEGDSAGWTRFTKLEAPAASVCPAVPTEFPTETPTDPPTKASVETDPPSILITDAKPDVPTESPVAPESDAPTESPVETDAPTILITDAKPDVPTEAPATPETDAPTESPVETEAPTKSPVETESPETDDPTTDETFVPTSMSMNLSTDPLEGLLESIVMSMDLSMATRLSTLRISDIKSAKTLKFEKSVKGLKSEKNTKSEKTLKSDKEEKRRRLRVRPVVVEM